MAASTPVRFRRRALALLLASGLVGTAVAVRAQGAPQVSVRLVMIRASGQRVGGPESLDPKLAPWRRTLGELGYARCDLVGDLTGTGPFQQKIRFQPVLPRHVVDVSASSEPTGQIALKVDVARWAAAIAVDDAGNPVGASDARPENVVGIPLRVDSGSHFAVRVTDAFGPGQHLLLLVSATRVAEGSVAPAPPGG